jgi:hypothetical protein
MKTDEDAVGGFFEDLPVLIFILAGVSVLVSSAVWAEQEIAQERSSAELEFASEMLLEAVCADLFQEEGVLPTVDSLKGYNLSEDVLEAAGDRGCAVAIRECYPACELLSSTSVGDASIPVEVSSASRLMNAIDAQGLTVVVEVRVCVW